MIEVGQNLSGIIIVFRIIVLLTAVSFSASASLKSPEVIYEEPYSRYLQPKNTPSQETLIKRKEAARKTAVMDFFKEIRIIIVVISSLAMIVFYPLDKYCFNGKGLYLLRRLHGREKVYLEQLKETVSTIKVYGHKDSSHVDVDTINIFVDLQLDYKWEDGEGHHSYTFQQPADLLNMMLKRKKPVPVIIIGDLGSGKTTYLYYLASLLQGKNYRRLNLEAPLFPLLVRIRGINDSECLLQEDSLANILAQSHHNDDIKIWTQTYSDWLKHKTCLIMIDGLDEMRSEVEREKLYKWLNDVLIKHWKDKHLILITSRIEGFNINRMEKWSIKADVKPFDTDKIKAFLLNWFQHYLDLKKERAESPEDAVEKFFKELQKDEDSRIYQLAQRPLFLQMMAILWCGGKEIPNNETELYHLMLEHSLVGRDQSYSTPPVDDVYKAYRLIAPISLDMQSNFENRDERIEQDRFRQLIQAGIDNHKEDYGELTATEYCRYLLKRSGLLKKITHRYYEFNHKSFREFLCAWQIRENILAGNRDEIKAIIKSIADKKEYAFGWWAQVIRFLLNLSDTYDEQDSQQSEEDKQVIFKHFIESLHESDVYRRLDYDKNLAMYLDEMMSYAPGSSAKIFRDFLLEEGADQSLEKFYYLNQLQAMKKAEAYDVIQGFIRGASNKPFMKKAEEILRMDSPQHWDKIQEYLPAIYGKSGMKNQLSVIGGENLPKHIFNPHEFNAEYILIPAGQYKDDKLGEQQTEAIYFAKYPVTNRQYNQFVRFLTDKPTEGLLGYGEFEQKLIGFAKTVEGNYEPDYVNYLEQADWIDLLRSNYHDDKRFNGEDQPVVGISWYAARAYCFWLSCLTVVENKSIHNIDVNKLNNIFRLPEEKEWLWAAGRPEEGNDLKDYSWCSNDGPNHELANYGLNINKTTTVGNYLKGITEDGLFDIAGNVWEWQEGWYDPQTAKRRAVRGGSWVNSADYLPCSARNFNFPDVRDYSLGFRVVRQSKLIL